MKTSPSFNVLWLSYNLKSFQAYLPQTTIFPSYFYFWPTQVLENVYLRLPLDGPLCSNPKRKSPPHPFHNLEDGDDTRFMRKLEARSKYFTPNWKRKGFHQRWIYFYNWANCTEFRDDREWRIRAGNYQIKLHLHLQLHMKRNYNVFS